VPSGQGRKWKPAISERHRPPVVAYFERERARLNGNGRKPTKYTTALCCSPDSRLQFPLFSSLFPFPSTLMQSLSRLSYLPASLTRNKKLNRSDPPDPSLSSDSTLHLHRAPLAQIDQQLFTHSAADIISPAITPMSHPSTEVVPSRGIAKPIMARRASYTIEDNNLYSMAVTNNSSQGSHPAYRRLSQCVLDRSLSITLPRLHSPMRKVCLMIRRASWPYPTPEVAHWPPCFRSGEFFYTPYGDSKLGLSCLIWDLEVPSHIVVLFMQQRPSPR